MSDMGAPPTPPERIRIVDPDGHEIEPDRVVYLGPDPENGSHTFEAWFPADAARWARRVTIARLPAQTSLAFRFGDPS